MHAAALGNCEDPLLKTLFGSTNNLHRVSAHVNNLAQERHPFHKHPIAIPTRLHLMDTFAGRIIQKIDAENETHGKLLEDLKNVAMSMIEYIAKATHQWERRDALRLRVLTGKLQNASYVTKELVVEAVNQIIPEGKKKIITGKDELSGNVSNLIRIALNLSEPHRIGERSVNCIADVKFRKHGSDLVKALINAICFAYRDMQEKEYSGYTMPRLSICARTRKDMLVIEIDDNGIGVSPEILRKIREKDLVIKYKNGTGTGLYQCNQVVTRIGGTMNVQSALEKGFTTTIMVPHR